MEGTCERLFFFRAISSHAVARQLAGSCPQYAVLLNLNKEVGEYL